MKGKIINRHAPLKPDQKKHHYLKVKADPSHGAPDEPILSDSELKEEEEQYREWLKDRNWHELDHQTEECMVTALLLLSNQVLVVRPINTDYTFGKIE